VNILTVTMNPALDTSTHAGFVVPKKKIRCGYLSYAPGGGGINVSRALKKLGVKSTALILSGGNNGQKIEQLLTGEKVDFIPVDSGQNIRENLMVRDERTGNVYRFAMPGPEVEEQNWGKMLKAVKGFSPHPNYLVASGSLPLGVPDDFYARIASFAKRNDIKMVLDTSGDPLKLALEEGVDMIKPNLREIAGLLNQDSLTGMELEEAAQEILRKAWCSILIISLGAKGSFLARQEDICEYIFPPVMPVVSAVGAGDSMVAGIIAGCTKGLWPEQAVRYGVAAGTAAAMTPGSELCRKEDTDKIFEWLNKNDGIN
jgi:6-phosphofructokinase 2